MAYLVFLLLAMLFSYLKQTNLDYGIEKNIPGEGMFVRLEGNITEFDTIKLVNTNSENSNTIDITGMDGASALISVGKTF